MPERGYPVRLALAVATDIGVAGGVHFPAWAEHEVPEALLLPGLHDGVEFGIVLPVGEGLELLVWRGCAAGDGIHRQANDGQQVFCVLRLRVRPGLPACVAGPCGHGLGIIDIGQNHARFGLQLGGEAAEAGFEGGFGAGAAAVWVAEIGAQAEWCAGVRRGSRDRQDSGKRDGSGIMAYPEW